MLRHVVLVRTDASEEISASFIRVERIGELGKMLAVSVVHSSPILVTLKKQALNSSETSVLKRTTRRNIPEDTIQHFHLSLVLISVPGSGPSATGSIR
jgi:hypothetical protein